MQTPKLDTSILPRQTRFFLAAKHTELLTPDRTVFLPGKARVVALSADETAHVLRGNVQKQEEAGTPISTFEHGIRPKFRLDLKALEAALAPQLSRQIDTEIAAARRRVAGDVAVSSQLMEKELHSRTPQPDIPAAAPRLEMGTVASQEMEKVRARAIAVQKTTDSIADQMQQAIQQALQRASAGGTRVPASTQRLSPLPSISARPLVAKSLQIPKVHPDVSASSREMAVQLDYAKQHRPDTTALTAQLEAADKLAQSKNNYAQPVMDMVLTTLRQIPPVSLPASPPPAAPQEQQAQTDVIAWDEWHKRFALLARDPILKQIAKRGNPSGDDTVEITVGRNHSLTVTLATGGNHPFDDAMLQAYRSLDGNPKLEFPADSRRDTITFLIDNSHKGTGIPSGVQSQTSVGDREILVRNK